MIAVTFAHPSESRDFVGLFSQRHHEVKVLHTGIGAAACQKTLEPFLDSQSFDFLISSGFAGGTDPSFGVGNLLLAENFSDPQLLAQAREGLIARTATLVTAERVIESASERAQFARERGASAVDMETEWIAQACKSRGLRMLSLRAISDTAAAPFPAPSGVLFDLTKQKTNFRRLAAYLVTHPMAIIRLGRFTRQLAIARAELAVGLTQLVETLE
jgi:nucleoside phosphorylase